MKALLSLVAVLGTSTAFGLGVGDPAPPLKVAAIVKGTAVNVRKGIHVIEFWATWCGPCRTSIPHLTEMAKKYKGKVDFTGISVSETGPDQLGQVQRFVAAMGPNMEYNVAFDGSAKKMDLRYMQAANQLAIPTAFLVKDGVILWIGHPMGDLDRNISRVLAGSFDVGAAKREAARRAAEDAADEKRTYEENAAMAPSQAALAKKDYAIGLKELDQIDVSHDKILAHRVLMKRFYVFARLGDPRLLDAGKKIISENNDDAEVLLCVLARDLVDGGSNFSPSCYPTAVLLAQKACEIAPKEPSALECYATVLSKTGRNKEAAEAESRAIEYAKANSNYGKEAMKRMRDRLEAFRMSDVR